MFVEHGERPKKPKAPSASNAAYSSIMDPDVSFEDALTQLRLHAPRDMLIHGEAITRNLARMKAKKFEHKYLFGDPASDTPFGDFLRGPLVRTPGKSIFLYGDPALGKTHFALAHMHCPLLVSDIDDLKAFGPQHDGIVFDDMSFHHVPPEKVIHLVDQDFTRSIRCRHTNASIPAHTPKIFTFNDKNPFFSDTGAYPPSDAQKIAIMRRLDCYRVPYSLFNVRPGGNDLVMYSLMDGNPTDAVYHCDGQ